MSIENFNLLVSQLVPEYPSSQEHTKLSPETLHVPLFKHGFGKQGSTAVEEI